MVEWIGDGQGTVQSGIGVTAGPHIGSQRSDIITPDFVRIDAIDRRTRENAWVEGHADGSGAVRSVDFSGGEEACWDAVGVNAVCPAL
ncbi:MAG: hypothetical protein ACJATT_005492 [Myxococcota bacterium]